MFVHIFNQLLKTFLLVTGNYLQEVSVEEM